MTTLELKTTARRGCLTMWAKIWKATKIVYVLGFSVYFAVAGIRASRIPYFSDWLYYMAFQAIYAVLWPVAIL
jgi:hypothetical protein